MIPALDDLRDRVAELRQAQGLTQAAAADLADVSQSFVAKLERGTTDPSYAAAARLYNVLLDRHTDTVTTADDIMTGRTVTVAPGDDVAAAAETMKREGFSQLPVVEDGRCVGSVTSRTLLAADDGTVADVMGGPFPTVPPTTPADAVRELLRSASAVLVAEDGRIRGIITAADLL